MKLFVTAKTRAKEEGIEELDPIHLLVSVKEPPMDGKANKAIIKLLAHHFGVPQASVRIIVGLGTKEKVVEINDVLGLKRGTVRLAMNHTQWKEIFEKEKKRLRGVMEKFDIGIEHVGSTAMPSVPAKPIIDIAVGIEKTLDFNAVKVAFLRAGYEERGPQGVEDRILWVFGNEEHRQFYVHLTHKGSKTWHELIAFRNTLIKDKTLAREYAALKEKLSKKFANDRKHYTSGKNAFIERVVHSRK